MVYLGTQELYRKLLTTRSLTESGIRAGSAQVIHPHLQPEGDRSTKNLAVATERESDGPYQSRLLLLHGPCHVGYHWAGRSEHRVRNEAVPALTKDDPHRLWLRL
jgi:hypothetical protein